MGGGPSALFAMIAVSGGLCYTIYRQTNGRVEFKLKPDKHDVAFDLQLKKRNFATIVRAKHDNIDCMFKKGYYGFSNNNITGRSDRHTYSFLSKDMSKDRLIDACIECDVSTEVHYKYKRPLFGGTKHVKKTFKWADYYQDRIKM